MHTEQQLREMFHEAMAMPEGPTKFAALDSAIRHADASGNDKLAFDFRHAAVEVFTFGGDDRRAFLAFSQSLAAFDRDSGIADSHVEHGILWQFKWIVNALPDFPDVPLDRTYAVLDDMQHRYQRGGHSLHPVHQSRWQIALHVGDLDQAERSYHDMVTAKRDGLSNCSTCVPSAQTRYLSEVGRYEEAVAVGGPAKQGLCRRQPQWVQAYLMLPFLKTGRLAEAAEAHRNSYRKMRTDHTDLSGIGLHLAFLGLTGNENRGLELIEKHLPWLETSPSPYDSMRFTTSAVQVLNRLEETGFGSLALAGRVGGDRRRGQTTVAALRVELTAYTRELAARFDARNRTSYQSELVEQRMAAQPIVQRLPLSVFDSSATRKTRKLARLQERIVTHTQAGDATAAARARWETALAMSKGKRTDDVYAAAEEAALALERASLTEELCQAKHLLWELYRGDWQHRDAALAVLNDLLAAPSLPDSLPSKAELTEQGAPLLRGSESASRYVDAADLFRDDGDVVGEMRALRKAITAGMHTGECPVGEWLERADAIAGPAGEAAFAAEKANLDVVAARLLHSNGQSEQALARALAAEHYFATTGVEGGRHAAGQLAAIIFLRTGRAHQAEVLLRRMSDGARGNRYETVLLVLALRAMGRAVEADATMKEHDIEEWELEDADEE